MLRRNLVVRRGTSSARSVCLFPERIVLIFSFGEGGTPNDDDNGGLAQLWTRFDAEGCGRDPGAAALRLWDGDGLSDTPPEPMIHLDGYACNPNQTTIDVWCPTTQRYVTFDYPHSNILSYSAAPGGVNGAWLSDQQRQRIADSLSGRLGSHKRTRLE